MDAGEETMWNANYVIKTRGGNGLGTRLHVWGWVWTEGVCVCAWCASWNMTLTFGTFSFVVQLHHKSEGFHKSKGFFWGLESISWRSGKLLTGFVPVSSLKFV